ARSSLLRRHEQPAASFIQLVLEGRIPRADRVFIDHPQIVATAPPSRNPLSEQSPTRIAYSCSAPKLFQGITKIAAFPFSAASLMISAAIRVFPAPVGSWRIGR